MNEGQNEAAEGIHAVWSHRHGLRVQVRRSTARPGRVRVALRFDIADMRVRLERPAGVPELIERGLVAGGLGLYKAAQIEELFAHTCVRFTGVRVDDDAITYTATCRGDERVCALQLLRAYYADAAWRAEALPCVKRLWLDLLAAQEHDVDALVERRIATVLAGPYAWRRPATVEDVKAITFDAASDWLAKALNNDTLTITIVGDVPANAAETAAYWFGPYDVTNSFTAASVSEARESAPAAWPFHPGVARMIVAGANPRAVAHVIWPTDDTYDIKRTRTLDLLARCLSDRLQAAVLARFGVDASASAWSVAGDAFRGEGQIHAVVTVGCNSVFSNERRLSVSEHADQALGLICSESGRLADRGVEERAFGRAKKAACRAAADDKSRDDWWFGTVLPYASSQPFRVDWASRIEQDYQAVTGPEVDAMGRKYLVEGRAFAVVGVGTAQQTRP